MRRSNLQKSRHISTRAAASLLALALLLAGCTGDANVRRLSEPVSPISVGDPGEVSAKALAGAMLRAGFTNEEILELGPGIRRSIVDSGGANAKDGGRVVALFLHKEGNLIVMSELSGTFSVPADD